MPNAVEIKNLNKNFCQLKALDNLSLEIERGKITGLIGADASGKTTLMRIIAGLMKQDEGEISTLGVDPIKDKYELNKKIGYMPQKFGLYEDLTVLENLKLYADLKNVPYDFEKLLEFTKLSEFQSRLAGALSGGMKQKLGLACALMGEPELLVLDEPSVGVDPISRQDLMNLVRESISHNTTVIWSTSYLDEVQSFDRAVILDNGRLIFNDSPESLGKNSKEFESKVIELMGGYKESESLVAKDYCVEDLKIEYPVQALNLCKKYGDFYAVSKNSFDIKRGEIFGLLGPNGAGKSTSFKMMCGLSKPTSGSAKINGIDITKDPSKARSNLGYMAQKFSLYSDMTIEENLKFFAGIYGIKKKCIVEKVQEMIEIFGFKNFLGISSGDLPLGIKQRLSMACAIMHEPSILFLDEATSGVDMRTRKEFWNHIKSLAKKGVTILVTTHFMEEAEYCDRVSLFYRGKTIAVGTPKELKNQSGAKDMEEAFVNLIKESE